MSDGLTAQALATLVGGELRGDPSRIIRGVADLRSAGPDQVSFLGNQKYASAARQTRAGLVLIAPADADDFAFDQIRVASPSAAFAKAVEAFLPPPVAVLSGHHPTAVIAPDARLGEGVAVGPHVVIEAGVEVGAGTLLGAGTYVGAGTRIGKDCLLYPRVTLRERTVLGNRVILHSGVVIGSDGFGYDFQGGQHVKIPQVGYVQIDDEVEIGANTTVDRGRFDRTWIQRGTKIDNLVQIAHNVVIGPLSLIVAQTGISGSTSLGAGVTLAGQVGTVGHIHIGDRATVTAQSGVSKDVPAGAVVAGYHARPLKESLKLEALIRRLPELWERLKALEKRER
jgi:UDP-3-O-[3-hydroxymyristoyl] glucosamine N-acyltransferase